MILYSYFKRIKSKILGYLGFYHTLFLSVLLPRGDKRVYFQVDEIIPNRYLYNFLKFFKICGYTIYLPVNVKFIATMHKKNGEFQYSSWILKEEVKLGRPRKPYLFISREVLSNAYFNDKKVVNEYHVPMSEYPAMYFYNIETPYIKKASSRKNSVFMSGNIDDSFYNKISESPFFSIISRRKVYEYLKNKSESYLEVRSYYDLSYFIRSSIDEKILIINCSEHFRIPIREVKNILVNFNFYLGLPGMVMPQSHNIIEAMSVGCIPVLHLTYAKTFEPPLEHYHNAFTYESLEELEKLIKEALKLDVDLIQKIQNQVLTYYFENLSPKGVVNKIENNQFSKIYIQAEAASLNLLKKHE